MEGLRMSVKSICCVLLLACFVFLSSFAHPETHFHEFSVQQIPVKRLCKTENILTVNGQFPGPTLKVRNGDSLVVKVTNRAQYNVTIHWHGIRQLRNPWADGIEYVTQCPIKPGATYTYRFTITNQEGTLWWHGHSRWLRATVHGALIIYPKLGSSYPFPMPKTEFPIILGEWYDRNPLDVMRLAQVTGAPPNASIAFTINGQPGDLYKCSRQDTVRIPVKSGETILIRLINAAQNQQLFFTIANHKMVVVAADAIYTKPFKTSVFMIGPGQTMDILVTADQPPARYYIASRTYETARNAKPDRTTTTAILEYKSDGLGAKKEKGQSSRPIFPPLPAYNDTETAIALAVGLRSLPSQVEVPTKIDESLFFTVNLGLINCTKPNSLLCQGPNGGRLSASINNISFVFPRTNSLMQAAYQGEPGVFTLDFPPVPPVQFDYTGNVSRGLWTPRSGTKLYKLNYGSSVQIVLQDTNIVTTEDHPMHLHGYDFYVVGTGFGNYNPRTDPAKFNLVDPPQRNTIGTSSGGWVAIRFVADNPGVWFLHCHIDSHLSTGMAMAFLVENGVGQLQSVIPPPADLPQC